MMLIVYYRHLSFDYILDEKPEKPLIYRDFVDELSTGERKKRTTLFTRI